MGRIGGDTTTNVANNEKGLGSDIHAIAQGNLLLSCLATTKRILLDLRMQTGISKVLLHLVNTT